MHITCYENTLSEENCGKLISLFEAMEEKHVVYDHQVQAGHPQWTEMNLTQHRESWQELFGSLSQLFYSAFVQYITEHGAPIPHPKKMEELRMKRYTGDDHFAMHTDVTDHATARRYLAGILYLNDNVEGGEIHFPVQDLTVKPKMGDFLIFPPLWCFPHEARPTMDVKYIISGYAHYD
jgi:hypothetical protein